VHSYALFPVCFESLRAETSPDAEEILFTHYRKQTCLKRFAKNLSQSQFCPPIANRVNILRDFLVKSTDCQLQVRLCEELRFCDRILSDLIGHLNSQVLYFHFHFTSLSIVFWIISDLFHRPHVMELDT
jgi:hypothetical protein